MTITKIQDSDGNTLSSPELVYPKTNPETDPKTINFTHSVTKFTPASARDNAGLTLKAELENRDGKPLEAGEREGVAAPSPISHCPAMPAKETVKTG